MKILILILAALLFTVSCGDSESNTNTESDTDNIEGYDNQGNDGETGTTGIGSKMPSQNGIVMNVAGNKIKSESYQFNFSVGTIGVPQKSKELTSKSFKFKMK